MRDHLDAERMAVLAELNTLRHFIHHVVVFGGRCFF